MTTNERSSILILVQNPQVAFLLQRVLGQLDYAIQTSVNAEEARQYLKLQPPALMIISETLDDMSGIEFIAEATRQLPVLSIILMVEKETPDLLKSALRAGVSEYLTLPLKTDEVLRSVQQSLKKNQERRDWVLLEGRRVTASLQRKVDELETLAQLGRAVTSSLDLDSVLLAVVDAAVSLTGAEEGSLLLLDEETGELYMRAQRNFQDEFARTFRMPIQDNLLGNVLSTGKPYLLDNNTPQKIKTSYLVHSLLLVPLQIKDRVFGILGVDNRIKRAQFQDREVKILSALAEYAVIALQNAELFTTTTQERNKVEAIISRIQDGVVVVDVDRRLVVVNQTAQQAFNLMDKQILGRRFEEVFTDVELLRLMDTADMSLNNRSEIGVEDGRVFSAHVTDIPEVGQAITMHDITYLKKLDRIKSDFVSTVSHDLRSPLTAILGYVELIERAGPVNDRQREFIRRVHVNIHNITSLIDDLLNLGHIESGFDTSKESVYLDQIVKFSLENHDSKIKAKGLTLETEFPDSVPAVIGNPVQMRRMVDNLIENAIKYTQEKGEVTILLRVEMSQIIMQVKDNGYGIPPMDLPYIFDKFYRGSNVAMDVSGSGLGLSIVKSIVESHQGRVWVESNLGKGTSFTVVLPIVGSASEGQQDNQLSEEEETETS